ncbi:MAG: DUF1080 domain-containing protein [Armatimonadetes bacterium CG_4_10_14_3_um_filter_66_18]|nr:DUF1080 domain-containing protein [Armatimonadota bacterium]NDK14217.1 DUF1080 domain-containing protein [Armatimonadota bacterium]PIX36743.1 MAG: DUF1080 domain-containing protein [Armatimonadetes bacterium CG_4_8_14_3_um_filter_66_20]PIY39167.1 MAG: DUF1080 domain-containing protein [Armatimonadetes bacterium CG_4_10_14_3_um_filter_66_18]
MKQMLCVGLGLCLAVSQIVSAQPASPAGADAYMGDWEGTLKLGGAEQSVAVYMIPQGDGKYQARVASEFNKRVPVLFDVRGLLQDAAFRAVDAVPFDVSRVLGTTGAGVVVDASLWTGKLEGGVLTGTVDGKDKGTFTLKQAERTSPTLGQKPPAGAIVLFDGTNLDAWQKRDGKPAEWRLVEGEAMQVGGGDVLTKEEFGDFRLHLEFRTPYMPTSGGQGRGNSGVYVQGRYEVQVLDSYGLEGADNECGGIYQIAQPAANMCFPPLAWQTYDMTFQAPRFGPQGERLAGARVTVMHNGVTIHDDLELPHVTPGGVSDKESPTGPLLLQDHGNPVQYRNIWIETQK